MFDYVKEQLTRLAPRLTYGGSAVTGGSAYAAQGTHSSFVFSLTEIGVAVGIITALLGLALQAYLGFDKRKSDRAIAKARIEYYKNASKKEFAESEQS